MTVDRGAMGTVLLVLLLFGVVGGLAYQAQKGRPPRRAHNHTHATTDRGLGGHNHVVSLGDDEFHAEVVLAADGKLYLFTLGADETSVVTVPVEPLPALLKGAGDPVAVEVTFTPAPQSGDPPGTTSRFAVAVPTTVTGRPLELTVPNLTIEGKRFRFTTPVGPVDHATEMPAKVTDDAERQLYLVPGGAYTAADIDANSRCTASEKFKGFRAKHDSHPKAGDRLCPVNRLLWRHTPRRLSAEEVRDATLAAAGTLDLKRPAGSPAKELRMVEMRDNGPEAKAINDKADAATYRSVYLPLLRGVTPHALEAFDPVDQTLVTGTRDTTTVPSQALFLLNSPFVRKQALAFAERLLKDKDTSDSERIRTAYRLALGRTPTEKEIDRAKAFVGEYESAYRTNPPKPEKPPKKAEQPKPGEPPLDPDQIDQTGEQIVEDVVQAKDAKTAAWMAFTQALIGSAEFRYVK
jgi:hypothetical protein